MILDMNKYFVISRQKRWFVNFRESPLTASDSHDILFYCVPVYMSVFVWLF